MPEYLFLAPQVQEFDDNHDGKPDVITVTGTASGTGMQVHSVKVLLDFKYMLKVARLARCLNLALPPFLISHSLPSVFTPVCLT